MIDILSVWILLALIGTLIYLLLTLKQREKKNHIVPLGTRDGVPVMAIRREISLEEFRSPEFALSVKTFPKEILRSWGFNPDKEIIWWDEPIRQVRVLVQEVKE